MRGQIGSTADGPTLGASFFAFYYFALIGWVQGGFVDPAPVFEHMLGEHLRGIALLASQRPEKKAISTKKRTRVQAPKPPARRAPRKKEKS